jgi:hypothetical protein
VQGIKKQPVMKKVSLFVAALLVAGTLSTNAQEAPKKEKSGEKKEAKGGEKKEAKGEKKESKPKN